MDSLRGNPLHEYDLLQSKKESEITRERIFDFIKRNPGSHLRKIKKETGASMGATEYHLQSLETKGRIVSKRTGVFRRFYPSSLFHEKDQVILSVLHLETERDILLYLIQSPGSNQKQVSVYMRISAASVYWHMERLEGLGLIFSDRKGRFVNYYVAGDSKEIILLLKSYKPSIWEKWTDRLENILREMPEEK